jgi:hypothetical protein
MRFILFEESITGYRLLAIICNQRKLHISKNSVLSIVALYRKPDEAIIPQNK